jgi:alpha-N-arabinofuranosidase
LHRSIRPAKQNLVFTKFRAKAALLLSTLALMAVATPTAADAAGPTSTPSTRIVLTTGPTARAVSPDVFGAIMDWPDNAMGAFDPATRTFKPAFLAALKRSGVKSIRFVDGNSARCCFEWQRAIGPVSARSPNMTLDGLPGKPSTVGPDEIGSLISEAGDDGMAITNFDRQDAKQAAEYVAYMTAPVSTKGTRNPANASYWAELRAKNGHPKPYPISYWDVGNEEDLDPSGWITGREVSIGPHSTMCTNTEDCLYAFGGTTAFVDQPVVGYSDLSSSASLSTGKPDQVFYASAPPVSPGSQMLSVGNTVWRQVASLSASGPADVYTINDSTGAIHFGDGTDGAIPAARSRITLSYNSGPHDGFEQYYSAMKAMNPYIKICSDAENLGFFQAMGTAYPYDCVSWHLALVDGYPPDSLGDAQFMEEELQAPYIQGAAEMAEQRMVDRVAHRHVPVLVTAYGHEAGNQPTDLPNLHLSLVDGLLQAAQLEQWISNGVVMADRYQLDDAIFAPGGAPNVIGNTQAAYNVLIASNGSNRFLVTPAGLAVSLLSRLTGQRPIRIAVLRNPTIPLQDGTPLPVLSAIATTNAQSSMVTLVVINQSLSQGVSSQLSMLGHHHGSTATVSTLDGPNATSTNTLVHPKEVRTSTTNLKVGTGGFTYRFPAHSVTSISLVI